MAFTMHDASPFDELSRGVNIDTFHDPMVNLATSIDFLKRSVSKEPSGGGGRS
jgi:hypothetical protein